MTLEENTLLQLQKCLDAISSAFWKYLSTNKIWPLCNKFKAEHYNITKLILPPDTHSKYVTAKEDFEALSISLRVNIVKDATISSSKAPKSHVKLVTHMHYDNGFELLIAVFFAISPQLGGIGHKAQYLVAGSVTACKELTSDCKGSEVKIWKRLSFTKVEGYHKVLSFGSNSS